MTRPDRILDRPALLLVAVLTGAMLASCAPHPGGNPPAGNDPKRLPTGAVLDPTGTMYDVGGDPLAVAAAPERDRVVLALNGYGDNGIRVVQTSTGKVLQTIVQPAGFVGLAFDAAGRRLYASGGNRDLIYRYDWRGGVATLADSIVLEARTARQAGVRYPAGLALSPDGRFLYVVENLSDSLAVVDLASNRVVQRLPAGRYPYAVVVASDGRVFASAWGSFEVRTWRPVESRLEQVSVMHVPRHPSALLLNNEGSRLFVASASTDRIGVIDTRTSKVVTELVDTVPGAAGEGSTPNALALSGDGRRLFVAEADNNAVAVFDLSASSAGAGSPTTPDRLVGRIPVGWYPSALTLRGDTLIVVNAKGRGTAPNGDNGPGPGRKTVQAGYTLGQISGSVSVIPLASLDFAALSRRVARANGWDKSLDRPAYPPLTHVIYIIKENRTYDQVLGDLRQGDGDTSLTFFPRAVSPNQHALAERFGLFDRFFVNAEVSADGHNWTTAAYTTDYVQKTVPLNYGGKGRPYDYEGENRGKRPDDDDDVASPVNGYLWDLARKKGITFRNFGEYVAAKGGGPAPRGYAGLKPFLDQHTDSAYPGFDLNIPDQRRADVWLAALKQWEQAGEMPALQIVRLPNDHTMGARVGQLTPRAYMADNDLALGRMIDALSHGQFWKNTIVFVLEDDAQNGPDHVDSHRAPMLVISAWNASHTWHRFTNTTDVIETIEELLTLQHLSQFDTYGRPLRGIFSAKPDLTPYSVLTPATPLTEKTAAGTPGGRESAKLDFRYEDLVDDNIFNHILWSAIKGESVPYPGTHALTAPVAIPH